MVFLMVLMFLVSIFLYLTVVVDMFKQKTWLGFLGLFLFPFTFYHSIKNYSGNRKKMSISLISFSILPVIFLYIESSIAEKELSPFMVKMNSELNVECYVQNSVASSGGIKYYTLHCHPRNKENLSFRSSDELLSVYEELILSPALEYYSTSFGKIDGKGTIMSFSSTTDLYACFKISNPSNIEKSWVSSSSDVCG